MSRKSELFRQFIPDANPRVTQSAARPVFSGKRENLTVQVYDHIAGFNGICRVTPDLACGADRKKDVDKYCAQGWEHCFVADLFNPTSYSLLARGTLLEHDGMTLEDFQALEGTLAIFWTNPRRPSVSGVHLIAEVGRAQENSRYRNPGPDMYYVRGDARYACRFDRGVVSLSDIAAWDSTPGKIYDWASDNAARDVLSCARKAHERIRSQGVGPSATLQQIGRLEALLTTPRHSWLSHVPAPRTSLAGPVRVPTSPGPDSRGGSRPMAPGVLQTQPATPRTPDVKPRRQTSLEALSTAKAPQVPPTTTRPLPPKAVESGPRGTPVPPLTQVPGTSSKEPSKPRPVERPPADTRGVGLAESGPPRDKGQPPPVGERDHGLPVEVVVDAATLVPQHLEAILSRYWRVKGRLVGGETELHALVGFVRNFRSLSFRPVGLALQADSLAEAPQEKQLQSILETLLALRSPDAVLRKVGEAPRRAARLADVVLQAAEFDRRTAPDPDGDNLRAIIARLLAGTVVPRLGEFRAAMRLEPNDDVRRPMFRALLRGVEALGFSIANIDSLAGTGHASADDLIVAVGDFVARINGRTKEETKFLRAVITAALPSVPSTTRLLCLASSVAGMVESVVVVGAIWRSLDPFKAPHSWSESVPPVERWRDEADALSFRSNESGQATAHWGEGARRIDALGSLAGDFASASRQQAVTSFYREVVEQLGEANVRLGSVIARHIHDVLPALEVEVWETAQLRPVHRGRLAVTGDQCAVEYRDGEAVNPVGGFGPEARRTLESLRASDAPPDVLMTPLPAWAAERGLPAGSGGVGRFGSASGRGHVCTVSLPLRVGDAVVEILRVSLLSESTTDDGLGLSQRVAEDLSFPLSLAAKHAKGVRSGQRGAQQDIAAMVSHSIKNWLQPANADLSSLSSALDEHMLDDDRIEAKIGSLRHVLSLIQDRVQMLYLLSSQTIAETDVSERSASEFLYDLTVVFARAWEGFTKDNDYSSKIDAYSHDGEPLCPRPEFALAGDGDTVLFLHRVSVEYAFEEVFLNCFRHSTVTDPRNVSVTLLLELVPGGAMVQATVVNPGSLPEIDPRGGTESGGKHFGRQSLEVILENLLRGRFSLKNGGGGVEAQLRFPVDQRNIGGLGR